MADKKKTKTEKKPEPAIRKSELGSIRKMLVEKREALMSTMKKNQDMDAMQDIGDEADQAGQSIEKELLFELSDNERTTLDQIEGALRKMDKGTYGLCESCQKPIPKMRIKALPFARYCIVCQNSAERAIVA
jgi:DnaK suppressor protein